MTRNKYFIRVKQFLPITLVTLAVGFGVGTQNANADDMMGSMPPASTDAPAMTDPADHDHEQMVKDHKKMMDDHKKMGKMDAAAMKGSKSPMKKKAMPMKDKSAMPMEPMEPMEPGHM